MPRIQDYPLSSPRHAADGLQSEISNLTSQSDFSKSLTQQNFADEVDINNIIERWTRTGVPPTNPSIPRYGDFSTVQDFHTSMNIVISAQEHFSSLDARTRSRFGNDPVLLLEFLSNPENKDEAIKLGLVLPPNGGTEGGESIAPTQTAGNAPTPPIPALKPE